jgi:dTDP-4-dehydrorhamnose reductase
MKIIVTGVNGQLGYDVVRELNKRYYNNVMGIDIKDLDLTNK